LPAAQLFASELVQTHTLDEEKETVSHILDAISSGSDDEECKDEPIRTESPVKSSNSCLLMNTDDRYQPYNYTFSNDSDGVNRVVFSRPADGTFSVDPKPIIYDLDQIMACTLDSEDAKNYCRNKRHFALNIIQKKTRKVYFTKYEQML